MFEYIFYKTYSLYKYKWNETMPGIYACGINSIFQGFNLIIIVYDYYYWVNLEILHVNKYYGFLMYLCFMFVNYILYYKFTTPQQIEKKWKNASKKKIRIMNIISISYMFLTIFLFVLSVYIMHYR